MENVEEKGRSREGAWIEITKASLNPLRSVVAPVRERGLKFCLHGLQLDYRRRRSREGAWIEMDRSTLYHSAMPVAPVRERGLKCQIGEESAYQQIVAPVRERGLKSSAISILFSTLCRSREGAWIEISCGVSWRRCMFVAPVRERGLKYFIVWSSGDVAQSLP